MGDLMAGDVQFYFYPVIGSFEYIQSGKIRALGVTSELRLPAAPDIPTFKELGYPAMSRRSPTESLGRRLCPSRWSNASTLTSRWR